MDSDISDNIPVKKEAEDTDVDEREEPINKEDEPNDVQDKNDSSLTDIVLTPANGTVYYQSFNTYGTAFPCEFCSYSYKVEQNWKSHMANNHAEEYYRGDFLCDYPGCGKALHSEGGLRVHKYVHKRANRKTTIEVDESAKDFFASNADSEDVVKILKAGTKRQRKSITEETGSSSRRKNLRKKLESKKKIQPKASRHFTSTIADQATSTSRANITLAVLCPNCPRTFASVAGMAFHRANVHADVEKEEENRKKAAEVMKKRSMKNVKKEMLETQSIPTQVSVNPDINTTAEAEVNNEVEDAEFVDSPFDQPEVLANNGSQYEKTVKSEDVDEIMIIDEKPAVQDKSSTTEDKIQKDRQSLSVGVYLLTQNEPNKLIVIWSNRPEDDLLVAARDSSNNIIICIKGLDFWKLTEEQRKLISASKQISFVMSEKESSVAIWSVISFGEENCPNSLENQMFTSFKQVETILSKHAEAHQKTIQNVMRYAREDFFHNHVKKLSKKILVFNYPE